jgi:ubiquinol-cytochrome c reductase cytochrome c subunit
MKHFSRFVSGRTCSLAMAMALFLSAASAKPAGAQQEAKGPEAPAGNAENGKKLFARDGCYQCHGREAQGSTMGGPRIGPDPIPFDALLRYVRKPTGEMPPYTAKVISDQELADVYAFLQSRARPSTEKAKELLK